MELISKNKKVILLLCLLLLFSFSSSVLAYEITLDNKTYNIPDLPLDFLDGDKYILLTNGNDNDFILFTLASEPYKVYYNGNDNIYYTVKNSDGSEGEVGRFHKMCYTDEGVWINGTDDRDYIEWLTHGRKVIESAYDIINEDGTVFFFKTVVYQIQQIQMKIHKALIILVPVGLIIFCSFLLVYLISSKKWLTF